jgi:multiple antibiotic resistance protein
VNWRAFGETFVTLLVITDPIGNAPIFLSVTRRLTPRERQRAAMRACLFAGIVILGFAAFGNVVLRYLNVSIGSLSIAGGLLLGIVSLEMLLGIDFPTAESEDVALVPLAAPLVAGPGAIATAMVLWRSHPHASGHVAVILAIFAAVILCGVGAARRRAANPQLRADRLLVPHANLRPLARRDRRPARRQWDPQPVVRPAGN